MASQVTPEAVQKIRMLGFVESEAEGVEFLLSAARRSAMVTSTQGNRRYGVLFLSVLGGLIVDVRLDEQATSWCETCMNTEIEYDSLGETHPCSSCSVDKPN